MPAAAVRPRFHLSPPANWLSDPNGLVWHAGYWHLYYQHNPHGEDWGHMAWGHARSTDLVDWEPLDPAMLATEKHFIFSGCAVVDHANSAGFGPDAMIALFTAARLGQVADRRAKAPTRAPATPSPAATPHKRAWRARWRGAVRRRRPAQARRWLPRAESGRAAEAPAPDARQYPQRRSPLLVRPSFTHCILRQRHRAQRPCTLAQARDPDRIRQRRRVEIGQIAAQQ